MICVHVSVTVEMGTMKNNEGTGVQHAMIKPVYIKHSEIQLDRSNKMNDFEMYESLHLKVGDNIHCIQLERDLWRVFLKTRESRSLLVVEGLDLETYPFRFMIRTPIQLELLVRETKCSK